ncbi:alpha/beta-hydrolase [Macrolepiota fuliginosa MF-IS2]|uniref:Alpha/beta-hydrolase n=1 Tax=Macrolepiota fuliginosa MF-IS2 TaxID=1400762 RepID=A0A9P5XGB4_9AGAR|nr:alpha/beta-hydrolase [Macrolepiota fuliginosa MF-IS2]
MSEISPLLPRATQYGRPSLMDRIKMFFTLLPLPIVIIWSFLFKSGKTKSKKRVVFDRSLRYVVNSLNVRQLQHVMGTTRGVYDAWCKRNNLGPDVEGVGEGANLLWVGERGLDKVIIYLHGGAFLLPPFTYNLDFFHHVRTVLRQRGVNASVVLVEYTLVPEAIFPTPLKQAVAAINHLMNLGVDPQNMQLVGDSAGGNLVTQVLAHLLHPLESERVPALSLPAPFKGVYVLSPWVDLTNIFKTLDSGEDTDFLTVRTLTSWGSTILGPVSAKNRDYVEPNSAAEDWWKGVDAFVDRVLITAGEDECLKNEIIRFHSTFDNFHSHAKLVVQDEGIHNDPLLDFAVGKRDGSTTQFIIDWLTIGFQEPTS